MPYPMLYFHSVIKEEVRNQVIELFVPRIRRLYTNRPFKRVIVTQIFWSFK